MVLRFLTADRIHDGRSFLPEGSVIGIAEDGSIISVNSGPAAESLGAEHFDGLLMPGFVNAHCHLELSHMKGMIPERTGLIPFLQGVTGKRFGFSDEQKQVARAEALKELLGNGVVAIGDIANTTDSLDLRAYDQLHFHTFVECLGFTESAAAERLAYSMNILEQYRAQAISGSILRQSIVPHAPYSVSPALFSLIDQAESKGRLSIHNQEASAEDQYYQDKTGPVRDLLEGFKIDDSFFSASGKSSLQTYLPGISADHPIIFVHNTFSSPEDIRFAERHSSNAYWCLCPRANLYIEGSLPDIKMLREEASCICIGTDSLASNSQLSVLAELQVLNEHFPEIGWEELLRWGTLNGAEALGMDHLLGSIETGKKPGILFINNPESGGEIKRVV